MSRIAHLVKKAQAARSFDLTRIGDRDAIKIVTADGSQVSFLSAKEVDAFLAAIAAEPEVWSIEGLPACTWDAISGSATGCDRVSELTVTIVGTHEQLTAAASSHLAAAYRSIVQRRDELVADIGARMAPLYNKTWRDGLRLGVAEITKRLRITAVHFSIEEAAAPTLWLDDGGLFGGHSIEVMLDNAGAIASCELAG